MENIEAINSALLSVAIACLCLAVPVGLAAIRVSPWWRKRAKHKKHSTVNKKARDEIHRTDAITFPKQPRPRTPSGPTSRKPVFRPSGDLGSTGNSREFAEGLRPLSPDMVHGLSESPNLGTVFPFDQDVPDYSWDNDDLLPSGYTRTQYHEAGIDDSTIEYWGFDRDPGAPSPEDADVAIAEAMEEGW